MELEIGPAAPTAQFHDERRLIKFEKKIVKCISR